MTEQIWKAESVLAGWDLVIFGYPSGFWWDLAGIRKADLPVQTLADELRQRARGARPRKGE